MQIVSKHGRLAKAMISDRVISKEKRKEAIQNLRSLAMSFRPYFGYVILHILCLWMHIHVLFDALWTSNAF